MTAKGNCKYTKSHLHVISIILNDKFLRVNVVLGEHNISSPIDCHLKACAPKPKVVAIEKVTQHPDWLNGRPQFFDDIALLRLAEDVQFSCNNNGFVFIYVHNNLVCF